MDRGYRDVLPLLENLDSHHEIPILLQLGQHQLDTQAANDSRIITKTKWLVEARNGHIKSVIQFFEGTFFMSHTINIGNFYRIVGAILDKYLEPNVMEVATAEVAERILEKSRTPNVIQARIEMDNLQTRNACWA